ncbi:LysR family transcriptional regulator [Aurantimonas sp. Leaf443]|uniref:LysR family transcriptional regulator n=1 Tax=Aurantimonas sp. Leaf443 TaxID=1736378 RepID=UPI0006F694A5|nr:LysR family transcriptional regulator [Aurantimonas sp. Leaf443]KQT85756.1 LysR family transcriptional regulator [Aurantimonas sp. Leaf443]
MQIRALVYFNELARCRSMRQAAERLNVAPTAISRQVENLEHQFGTPLVERGARGIRLTAAGELLADRLSRTLRDLEQVNDLIDDLKGLRRGKVAIVTNGALTSGILAPALAAFSADYPSISFRIAISSARAAIDLLAGAEADLALTIFTPPHPDVAMRFSGDVVHAAVVAPGHPLAARPHVTMAEIAAFPLAIPEESFGARLALEETAAQAGVELQRLFVTNSLEMQKELARRGAAVLILPALAVAREIALGELTSVPIRGGWQIRTRLVLSVARGRPLSFAASKLVAHLERHLGALIP